MGALHGGNGGGRPPDGGGLPELPPEWGDIIVPDDPSALAAESAVVRRQLRRYDRSRRWRRRMHLRAPKRRFDAEGDLSLGAPLLVMAIAVVATLISLFAIGWPVRGPVTMQGRPSAAAGATTKTPAGATATPAAGAGPLASLELPDTAGVPVRLGEHLPAVILLVDGCDCEPLIAATSAAADPRITVLAIAADWPQPAAGTIDGAPPAGRAPIRRLVDPGGLVRAAIPALTAAASPDAALISSDGSAVTTVPHVTSVNDFLVDLPRLLT